MSDISFTEMGKALDAAAQSREPSSSTGETSVSSASTESSAPSGGSDRQDGEGDKSPSSAGTSPAPTTTTPAGGDVSDGGGKSSDGNAPGKSGEQKPSNPDDKGAEERRKWNNWQARKRIAERERKRQRQAEEMQRLQQKRDYYADEQGGNDPQMARITEDQMRELAIASQREAQQEWEQEAYEVFAPEDAGQFIRDSQTYSDWINKREPELASYITKPYGKHLLKGWFDKIAKVPEMADRWEAMNSHEKFTTLQKFYDQLEDFGRRFASGEIDEQGNPRNRQTTQQNPVSQPTPQQGENPPPPGGVQTPDAPVPGSGRNTSTMPPNGNFALMLEQAMNRRRK